ncbi:MAG TPA: hypothetical protein VFX78_11735 [Candidatus Eisenbacteria bacterium]|nr:hypothetical protein [Candidatus Eisenbacteria bacterium]
MAVVLLLRCAIARGEIISYQDGSEIGLRLDAVLDDSTYAVDQPVLLLLRLSNTSSDSIEIPSMRIYDRYLNVRIARDERPIQRTIRTSDEPPRPAGRLKLPPGAAQVETTNLLFEYGGLLTHQYQPVASVFGQFRLQPGRYSLQVEMDWPTAPRSSVRLWGPLLHFSVWPWSKFPEDSVELHSLVEQCGFKPTLSDYLYPNTTEPPFACCRGHLSYLKGTRLLALAYYACHMPNKALPTDSLMTLLHDSGTNPVVEAAILFDEIKFQGPYTETGLGWLESGRAKWRAGLNSKVLSTWRERQRQRRFILH